MLIASVGLRTLSYIDHSLVSMLLKQPLRVMLRAKEPGFIIVYVATSFSRKC